MKAVIKSIGSQYVMEDEEYQFIKDNLNKPLSVISMSFGYDGSIGILAVSTGSYDVLNGVVSLFVGKHENDIKYELIGELPMSN